MRNTFFCACILLGVMSCKKESDSKAPEIVFINPDLGAIFNYGDTIDVVATIKDEQNIASVRLSVTNATGEEFLQIVNYSNSGTEKRISTSLFFNDIFLETGTYYISISASDGENEAKSYREITLIEGPTLLEDVYIEQETSFQETIINRIIDGGFETVGVVNDFSGFSFINSRLKSYVFAQEVQEAIGVYSLPDIGLSQFYSTSNTSSADYFRSQHKDPQSGVLYFGSVDGIFHTVNSQNQYSIFSQSNLNFYPKFLTSTSDLLVAVEYSVNSTERRIVTYNKDTKALLQSTLILEFDQIVAIVPLDDNTVLIIGNSNSNALFKRYNANTNTIIDVFEFYDNSAIQSVVLRSDNQFYVAHEDAIRLYGQDIQVLSEGLDMNVKKMEYEGVEQRLYVIDMNNNLKILNETVTQLLNTSPISEVTNVHFLYNR